MLKIRTDTQGRIWALTKILVPRQPLQKTQGTLYIKCSLAPVPMISSFPKMSKCIQTGFEIIKVDDTFKGAKRVAYIGAIILTVVLIVIWPAASTATGVFAFKDFTHWVCTLSCLLQNTFSQLQKCRRLLVGQRNLHTNDSLSPLHQSLSVCLRDSHPRLCRNPCSSAFLFPSNR